MARLSKRVALVAQRCTPAALDALTQFAEHPDYQILVAQLEKIGGMIFLGDVEKASAETIKR